MLKLERGPAVINKDFISFLFARYPKPAVNSGQVGQEELHLENATDFAGFDAYLKKTRMTTSIRSEAQKSGKK